MLKFKTLSFVRPKIMMNIYNTRIQNPPIKSSRKYIKLVTYDNFCFYQRDSYVKIVITILYIYLIFIFVY